MDKNFNSTNSEYNDAGANSWIQTNKQSDVSRYIAGVYGWMCLALGVTALVAGYIVTSETILGAILGNKLLFYGLIIGQVAAVIFLSVRIQKLSFNAALAIFLAYAALNGLTFAMLLLIYTSSSVMTVFAITSATFGVMSAVGYFTKQDLTSFGRILMFGLIGLIIASVVNLFMQNETVYWITSYIGVFVFVGLIAYDTQKIKNYALLESEADRKKGAIMGALALYLDFINLFIYLLRLFGDRR